MIELILLIIVVIALWAGVGIGIKRDNDVLQYLCGFFGGFASVGLLSAIICICVAPSDAEEFVKRYERCTNYIESINEKMTTETINDIISGAIVINEKIENHRKHVDSKFSGVFYSHKIAELELIELPELKVEVAKEDKE